MFALSYGLSFATVVATLTHVLLFNGKDIYGRFRASYKGKIDIHTKLMRKYKDIPSWWFHAILALSLLLCTVLKSQVQLPWWALIFACAIALIFTLPSPGLNVITEYIIGLIFPGKPIANVCFKTYGYISMSQAVSFLQDFKLGHYMKIPPRSMFVVQLVGTFIASTINMASACDLGFSRTKVILRSSRKLWCIKLVLLRRRYSTSISVAAAQIIPKTELVKLINIPVLLGATAAMPPANTLNFNSWIVVGFVFNFLIFRYRKKWWQRYNYVLSAALDAGLAFMGVFIHLFFGLTHHDNISWWGNVEEYCDLANCPTAKGIQVHGCPLL
ncbi:hypothetical protein HAX54_009646 [Datura stramonium]|uniref:Oligopeptide transporter n=1 Tax=Datura stramonium TaxID=4076 RepID=A0ABS8X065_DATST|nr:hypothetical protein [Datura stramonium]